MSGVDQQWTARQKYIPEYCHELSKPDEGNVAIKGMSYWPRLRKCLFVMVTSLWRKSLFLYGVAASVEHVGALRGIYCSTVVDIGANRGQFSLLAREMFPNAQIEAFEPLAAPASVYRRVFASDSSVRLHQCAIGDAHCEVEMHVAARDDSSSLLPITGRQVETFPGTEEVKKEKVSVRELGGILASASITSPALMKVDVQGYELSALRGADSVLRCFDWVYCECSFVELYHGQALADEVISWLRDRDFYLKGVYNTTYGRDGKAVQSDFLFERRGAT